MKQELENLKHIFSDHALSLMAVVILMMSSAATWAQAPQGIEHGTDAAGKPPYHIVVLIVDQRSYRLFAGSDYSLPAIDTLARQGVTFRNHYTASAMCSPSRAALLTG